MPNTTVRRRFVAAVVAAAVTILPLYLLCPGAGPKYFLQGIPGMNAMPSGHLAWALLIFWFARKYCGRTVRVAAGVFVALTCLATLGSGEHYIIDLIMSVPFAAGIWALAHRQWRFAGISMAVVLTWLIVLREGWALSIPSVLVWILTGITVALFALHGAEHESQAPVVRDLDAFSKRVHAYPCSYTETSFRRSPNPISPMPDSTMSPFDGSGTPLS
jgi:hypothetical protein